MEIEGKGFVIKDRRSLDEKGELKKEEAKEEEIKKTEEQKNARNAAIQEATKEATLVPFGVLEQSIKALELAKEIAICGNKNSVSDAGVAGLTAQTAAEGAYYNVIINLPEIQDEEFTSEIKSKAESLKKFAVKIGDEIRNIVEEALK